MLKKYFCEIFRFQYSDLEIMAVPFVMPEDQSSEVEVLISQLQLLLNRLQDALRRSRLSQSQRNQHLHNRMTGTFETVLH